MEIRRYAALTAETDIKKKPDRSARFYGLGLLGEIGTLLSAIKKHQRKPNSGTAYAQATIEEMGDVLWYFFRFSEEAGAEIAKIVEATKTFGEFTGDVSNAPETDFDGLLIDLMGDAVNLVRLADQKPDSETLAGHARSFLRHLAVAARSVDLDLDEAASKNLEKASSRWGNRDNTGQRYDLNYHWTERFPDLLRVSFLDRTVGHNTYCYQIFNGLTLGDRLTDNSRDKDGYRFHDCFHLAYAAKLGWSPVLRSLLKVKRKSHPEIDDHEDGARAQISEEGVANWLFGEAKRRQFFASTKNVETEMLATVKQMVSEFEVSNRPYWMWEEAILEGFGVFRALRDNGGGTVTVDMIKRSIEYAPPVRE